MMVRRLKCCGVVELKQFFAFCGLRGIIEFLRKLKIIVIFYGGKLYFNFIIGFCSKEFKDCSQFFIRYN